MNTSTNSEALPLTNCSDSSECGCWNKMNDKLNERGFHLSDKLLSIRMTPAALKAVFVIPIERLDGKKMRASDPKVVIASHCPWCGRSIEGQNAPVEALP